MGPLAKRQRIVQDASVEYDFVRELSHTTAESADTVWLVRHKKTGETLACKRISKRQEAIYKCSCRSAEEKSKPPPELFSNWKNVSDKLHCLHVFQTSRALVGSAPGALASCTACA